MSKKEPILVKTKLYRNITGFVISLFFLGVVYFIFYYQEKVFLQFDAALGLRVVDCLSLLLVIFFWIRTISYLIHDNGKRGILISSLIVAAARLIIVLPIMVFFTDDSYFIENVAARYIYLYAEGILVAVIAILLLIFMMKSVNEIVIGIRRYYIVSISLLLLVFDIWNYKTEVGLHWGKYGVSPWEAQRFDPFGLTLCLAELLTCIFIYRCDFSPGFVTNKAKEDDVDSLFSKEHSEQQILDMLAHKHQFTIREREVVELVYKGLTNPDIAEQMFISRNTVKVHIHNIYEKLDVSNRMELVHLVYSQNKPPG